jgi:hypothetical protein
MDWQLALRTERVMNNVLIGGSAEQRWEGREHVGVLLSDYFSRWYVRGGGGFPDDSIDMELKGHFSIGR